MVSGKSVVLHAAEQEAAPLLDVTLPEVAVYGTDTSDDSHSLALFSLYPSSYNAAEQGLVTEVKNQEPYGTCWAFSALSACETSMIAGGRADNTTDLSELHLSYFFFHSVTDPLGNTAGDANTLTSGDYLNTGGTDACTMFALAAWTGAAAESAAPYESASTSLTLSSSLAYQDVGHLQNVRYVAGKDTDSIKQLILTYGSISAPLYVRTSSYYNEDTASYYCDSAVDANHQLVLVGWDDNYARSNFNASCRPSRDGAWIAKNSYGTSFGDDGYLYISYEDASLTASSSLAFAYDMEGADNYTHNYQYDGSASCTYRTFRESGSIANVFTVNGNPGNRERLEAVSFALATADVNYAIQIYKNPTDGDPTSGIPVFDTPQTGTTSYCGYYTIPLNQSVVFDQGDRFSVVITVSGANGQAVSFFTDESCTIDNVRFVSSALSGQSYYRSSGDWVDLGSRTGSNLRVKAFTTDTTEPATVVLPDVSSLAKPVITRIKIRDCRSLKITWDAVPYAQRYEIYRSTSKKGTYKKVGTTKKTTFTDKKRKAGKTYYYKIIARGEAKSGSVRSPASAVKSKKLTPPRVSFTSAVKQDTSTASLTWKKVSYASGYEIYVREPGGSFRKLKTKKKAGSVHCTASLNKTGTWRFKVRAYVTVNKKKIYGPFSRIRSVRKR